MPGSRGRPEIPEGHFRETKMLRATCLIFQLINLYQQLRSEDCGENVVDLFVNDRCGAHW